LVEKAPVKRWAAKINSVKQLTTYLYLHVEIRPDYTDHAVNILLHRTVCN